MSKRQLPSLSKSALLLSPCLAWTAAGARHYDDRFSDTTKRDRGTHFHAAIAAYIQGKPVTPAQDAEMLAWYKAAQDYVDASLGPRCESIQAEVAIGVNWDTGEAKVLTDVHDRNYPNEDGWTYGTADLVCILKDGSLLVADWKTGGTEGAEFQLLSLACGFRKVMVGSRLKPTGDEMRKVRVSCLKVAETGVWPNERDAPGEELAIHWEAMRMSYRAVQDGPGQPYPGIHCTALYCPHLAFCEAVGGVVQGAAVGSEGALRVPYYDNRGFTMSDSYESDDHAGWVAERVTAAKRQLDYYTNALKSYVSRGGRVISGVHEWGPGPGGHRWRKRSGL